MRFHSGSGNSTPAINRRRYRAALNTSMPQWRRFCYGL
jgi:hypothetical protein